MKTLPTPFADVILLELQAFGDARGFFMETFRRDRYLEHGVGVGFEFVQDNYASSKRGSLRGLHYAVRRPQGKLVHVTRGEIFDVVVDLRRASPTFGKWFGASLSAANHRQLWIPPGFGHGYLAMSDEVDVAYKVTETYDPSDERSLRWCDPTLAIAWPLDGEPELSERDRVAPLLDVAELPAPSVP